MGAGGEQEISMGAGGHQCSARLRQQRWRGERVGGWAGALLLHGPLTGAKVKWWPPTTKLSVGSDSRWHRPFPRLAAAVAPEALGGVRVSLQSTMLQFPELRLAPPPPPPPLLPPPPPPPLAMIARSCRTRWSTARDGPVKSDVPALRCNPKQSDAIRSTQEPSGAIRRHQEAIIRHQTPSDVLQKHSNSIRSHQKPPEATRSHPEPPEAIRSHQEPTEAIRSNQEPSEAIRSHQKEGSVPESTATRQPPPSASSRAHSL